MAAVVEPGRGGRAELDDVTLERARRGERGACVALVERYQGPVYAMLSRFLGGRDRSLIDDLAQETFLRVFRELPRFRPVGAARPSTWILTIATRLAIDEHRRRDRRPAAIELSPELVAPERTDHDAERRMLGEAVARAVGGLPAEQRAAFLLRAYHDLDYAEIAEALECDLGTVKSRLSRARARLRSALSDAGDEP
jgi:RNA polymerase sigma-70 factor (ECF subfamily)